MNDRTRLIPALASLAPQRQFQVSLTPHTLVVTEAGNALLELTLQPGSQPDTLLGAIHPVEACTEQHALLAACEGAFSHYPGLQTLTFSAKPSPALASLVASGLLNPAGPQLYRCTAQALWQAPEPWLPKTSFAPPAQQYQVTDGKRHPARSAAQSSVVYRRFVPWVGQTLTFELADADRDLAHFNRWMNTPRVAHFWEEQGSLAQHNAYLQKQLAAPHVLPLIGRFDGQAFGYFEVYWAKEDRIAPFYDAQDYDRGLHLLVGEEAFRGQAFYTAWFSSMCHYLFLDDARTQRIVCEPRHDNQRQIANFDRSGFAKLKHFDFPHKRALLVMLTRERFFSDRLYQPLGNPTFQESAT
ncbi:MAG: GNAT family N-acetyltransferase [Pseudomonas sp.]|uniref:GNAT family N-acetyltransferase n=1 Tax=Pseudomonas abieticivorans TaxID=2931382 RepID=UPI0020C0BE0E|nr:GNAT family N-acetyltransferase [Pseudomonas sp. PIA16]MDE1165513.1 GNAT family N-acetyltransferase [Pseudomonas sp.]